MCMVTRDRVLLRKLLLSVVVLLIIAPPVMASSQAIEVTFSVVVNGTVIEPNTTCTMMISNGRILLSMQEVTNSLECSCSYSNNGEQVSIFSHQSVDHPHIIIEAGSSYAKVGIKGDGGEDTTFSIVDMGIVPIIVNDIFFVPLRFVAEQLGYTVTWDDNDQTAYITGRYYVGKSFSGSSLIVPKNGAPLNTFPPHEEHAGDRGYFYMLTDDYILQRRCDPPDEIYRVPYSEDSYGPVEMYKVCFFTEVSGINGKGELGKGVRLDSFTKIVFDDSCHALEFGKMLSMKTDTHWQAFIVVENVIYFEVETEYVRDKKNMIDSVKRGAAVGQWDVFISMEKSSP